MEENKKDNNSIKVLTIDELFKSYNLEIPEYQRPYSWSEKCVVELLNDIKDVYKEDNDYKYRIGTIILYKEGNKYKIVDGQQRIITLHLIKKYYDPDFSDYFIKNYETSDKKSIISFWNNKRIIDTWLNNIEEDITSIFNSKLEVLVIVVNKLSESFQLFDSQNTSGKPLYPHDLLKAFHIREMDSENKKMINGWVKSREEKDSKEINDLFNNYLFPIKSWIDKEDYNVFKSDDIDVFKGITNIIKDKKYNYTTTQKKERYQIDLPFYSGEDFFKMVTYYINRKNNLFELLIKKNKNIASIINKYLKFKRSDLEDNQRELENKGIIKDNIGMGYISQLFYSALFYYYDRFNSNAIDNQVINILFKWAFMLRIDLEMVNMKSINIYALGSDKTNRTTNHIPMFYNISKYRNDNEIYNIYIKLKDEKDVDDNWKALYNFMKNLKKENDKNE